MVLAHAVLAGGLELELLAVDFALQVADIVQLARAEGEVGDILFALGGGLGFVVAFFEVVVKVEFLVIFLLGGRHFGLGGGPGGAGAGRGQLVLGRIQGILGVHHRSDMLFHLLFEIHLLGIQVGKRGRLDLLFADLGDVPLGGVDRHGLEGHGGERGYVVQGDGVEISLQQAVFRVGFAARPSHQDEKDTDGDQGFVSHCSSFQYFREIINEFYGNCKPSARGAAFICLGRRLML